MNAVARGNIDAQNAMVGAKLNVVVVVAEEYVGFAKVEDDYITAINVAGVRAVENAINATAKEPCGAIGFVAKQA